jgi:hypothetical protein
MIENFVAAEYIGKFLSNTISQHEKRLLKFWVYASEENRLKFVELTDIDILLKKARKYLG